MRDLGDRILNGREVLTKMEKLAIFGGEPVRQHPIYYGRQCIEQDDVEAVAKTLTSDLITCGPRVC